jgi:methylase of polypeptide subunit release factors
MAGNPAGRHPASMPMIDIRTAIAQGADILAAAGVAEPRLTAQVLLAHALRRDRTYLYAHPEESLTTIAWIHFGRYLHERTQGKPLQHILKSVEFYGRSYRITPDVLIPRPETEHVVERALALASGATRIADVCTGSGILAVTLALEIPGATVAASDISPAAIAVAQTNSAALGAKIDFFVCDLMDALPGPHDLIVANPPYIASSRRPPDHRLGVVEQGFEFGGEDAASAWTQPPANSRLFFQSAGLGARRRRRSSERAGQQPGRRSRTSISRVTPEARAIRAPRGHGRGGRSR